VSFISEILPIKYQILSYISNHLASEIKCIKPCYYLIKHCVHQKVLEIFNIENNYSLDLYLAPTFFIISYNTLSQLIQTEIGIGIESHDIIMHPE
jgi:thymidylate synthase